MVFSSWKEQQIIFLGGNTPYPIPQSLVFAKSRYIRVHNPSRSLKVAMLAPFRQLTTRHSKCSGYNPAHLYKVMAIRGL